VESDSSRSQYSERHGDEHVTRLEAAAIREHVHACARVVDLRDLMTEKDVGTLGQPVGDLGVSLREYPVVPSEAKTLVVLEKGDVGARSCPFVFQIGSSDER